MKVISAIASTTIGEAIRRRVLLVILLIGILLLGIAPGLQVLSARQERTVLKSFMFGTMQLTAVMIAVILTVYILPTEIERRTIYTILCKPVRRWQLLVGKYLGAIGALGIMVAMMAGLSMLLYFVFQRDAPMSDLTGIAQVATMTYLQTCLLAAVSIALSTFLPPLVNIFVSLGFYLVGTLFTSVFETIQAAQGTSPIAKGFAMIVGSILPHFSRFNVQTVEINSQQIGNIGRYYLDTGIYGLVYIAGALIVGMLIFENREV